MEFLAVFLPVVLIGTLWGLLITNPKQPVPSKQEEPHEKISFPENTAYFARIFASYPNNEVLEKTKALIDDRYPFHGAPHGGTYYIARKREYYLNQYLWFYEKYKRFPRNDELIAEDYFGRLGGTLEIKPATWFTLINKNELEAENLFRKRLHLWISLKKSSGADYKKVIKKCDEVEKKIFELFEADKSLEKRRGSN